MVRDPLSVARPVELLGRRIHNERSLSLRPEFARLIGDDEHLMQTRLASGLWRWMLITLRERQAAGGSQNG